MAPEGYVLGSAGFDIALYHFVYQNLITEFDDLVIRSLTDDMPSFFRPEEGTGDQG